MRHRCFPLVVALLLAACGTYVDRDEVGGRRVEAGLDDAVAAGGTRAATAEDGGSPSLGSGAVAGPASADGGAGGGGEDGAAGGGVSAGGSQTAAAGAQADEGPATYDDGISDEEVKIGLTAPLSGIVAFVGEEMVGAVDAYVKLAQERGAVGGRRIKLVAYDDRLDPALVLANVKRLVEQDKVFMVYGLFSDSALEYVRQKEIPFMTFGVTAPPFSSKYPTVIPLVGNAFQWNQEAAYAAVEHLGIKPKRVAVLYDTTIFDERGYLKYFRATWERLGAEVVSMDPMNLSDGDCSSLALKMRSLDVEYWDFEGLGWLLCMPAMERIGWRPSLGMGGWPTSAAGIAQQVGPSIEGVLGGSQGDQPNGAPRQKTQAHDDYVAAIARYHPKLNTFGHLESPPTIGYWVGARLMIDALEAIAPNYTRAAFLDWLHNVKDYDVGIQPPIISLAPDCKRGSDSVVWVALWRWDAEKKTATRTPETPYIKPFMNADYGGDCAVTKVADEIVGA